jgi:hypothetical protein
MGRYYYDSYAMVEFVRMNVQYRPFFEKHTGMTTKINLMEVYFALLKSIGHPAALDSINHFSRYLVDFDIDDIANAMKLRVELTNRRRLNASYADALGYHLAKKNQIPFLTGDRAFERLEGVEFVKSATRH